MLLSLRVGLLLSVCALAAPGLRAQDVDALSLDSLLSRPVSTASKYEQQVAEVPASVAVVTAEDIARYGYRTLGEVLRSVRGFYVTDDHTRTYAGTRGFGRTLELNNRLLFLLNGFVLNETIYGAAWIDELLGLDLAAVDRIEVVRGPGSVLYGTGALFGVVNIITKQPPVTEGMSVLAEAGSAGLRRGTVTVSRTAPGGVELFATGTVVAEDGTDRYYPIFDAAAGDGWARRRDGRDVLGLMASVRRGGWRLQGILVDGYAGIPTGDFGTYFGGDARHLNERAFAELSYERAFGLSRHLTWRTHYQTSDGGLHYPVLLSTVLPGPAPADEAPVRYHQDAELGSVATEALFRWDVQAQHRLVVGVRGVRNHHLRIHSFLQAEDGTPILTFFDGTFPYHVLSVYAQDEMQLRPDLSLTLGLRHDAYSRAGTATTPRAALVYHPARATTFKLLYGEAFRAPSSYEVAYQGPEGIIANPDLKPERVETLEFVWEQRVGRRVDAQVSLFRYDLANLVRETWLEEAQAFQFQNGVPTHAYGAEGEVALRPSGPWGGYASYTYHRAHPDGGRDLPNAPYHLFKTGVSYARPDGGLSAQLYRDGARRTQGGDEVAGVWLVDLHGTWRPRGGALAASVGVRNVFDAAYAHPANAYQAQDVLQQDGRTVRAHLAYRF